jgi:hypothetical protein
LAAIFDDGDRRLMDEKFWLPTGADSWPVPDDALDGLSDDARSELLGDVRASIKQLKASRLAPPLEASEAIRAFEEIARRLEASFPSPPRLLSWRRLSAWVTSARNPGS